MCNYQLQRMYEGEDWEVDIEVNTEKGKLKDEGKRERIKCGSLICVLSFKY